LLRFCPSLRRRPQKEDRAGVALGHQEKKEKQGRTHVPGDAFQAGGKQWKGCVTPTIMPKKKERRPQPKKKTKKKKATQKKENHHRFRTRK